MSVSAGGGGGGASIHCVGTLLTDCSCSLFLRLKDHASSALLLASLNAVGPQAIANFLAAMCLLTA